MTVTIWVSQPNVNQFMPDLRRWSARGIHGQVREGGPLGWYALIHGWTVTGYGMTPSEAAEDALREAGLTHVAQD